jgi:EAL domain-containing protein (putative c-di-GMP-specific phosphodiesterase class I)
MKYLYDESFVAKKNIQYYLIMQKKNKSNIICEAVEDLKDVKKVQATGIEYVQGYLISKTDRFKKFEDIY